MDVSIAQMVALTVTGNAYLQRKEIGRFWPDNSTFNTCEAVQFIGGDDWTWGEFDALIATNPKAWLDLVRDHSKGIKLRVSAANGTIWAIEEIGENSSTSWQPAWRSWRRVGDAVNGRSCLVRYRPVSGTETTDWPQANGLGSLRDGLAEALEPIVIFAERNNSNFASDFRNGLSALSSDNPLEHAYHKDLGPPGFLSPLALQILGACQTSWVFGGMGSWNDQGYLPSAEGDVLSSNLWQAIQEGLIGAANSTFEE